MDEDLESRTVEISKEEADKTLLLTLKRESRLGKVSAMMGGAGAAILGLTEVIERIHNYKIDKLFEKISELESTYGYNLTELREQTHYANYLVAKDTGGICLIFGLVMTPLLGWWTYRRVKDYIKNPIEYLKGMYAMYQGREIKLTERDCK